MLPLTVLEGEGDLRVFADGLMDTITRRLSQYEGPESSLLVVPASEVRQQDARSARDAAKKFGATAVVEGSLQGQGDRVRLLLTLVDTREMRQKETMIVEEKRANALALQDAAVSKLANALSLRVQPRHARDLSPVAPGAYEFYLQARGYLQRSDKLANIENAIGLFRRALEMDERYAPAYSGLGEAYWYKFERTRDQAFIQEALKSCGRALTLNAGLPEAQIAMGRIHLGTGRHDEALRDFEKALAVDNRNSEAYQGLANTYSSLKQFEKAEATYRQAISLRPADWTGYKQLGLYYYRRGEFDKAIEQYDKVVALTPDNAQGYVNLGAFQFRKEDFRAAQKSWERALELDPDRISTLTNLAKLHAELGEYPQAIKLYERALKVNDRSFLLWGNLGAAYKRVGLEGKAAPALETAIHLVESELSVNPKRGDLYSYLAFYHAMAGRSKKVEGLLSKAFALAPDDPDILARAAETAELLGKRDQAMGFLRSAVAKGQPVENLKRSPILRGLADQLTREANPNSK
ncbi:MAG: tetratricopeptide repeat protein [Acidobacteria bacterium]|nr:tetratricopeptide repeat protein [Acidobacteriota bacterium]